jgi:transcriptional regulator with XRE-family HTH domain
VLFRTALSWVISEYRKETRYTLRQMINNTKAVISHNYLWEVEQGKKQPSSELLEEIAKAMGMNTAELVIKVGICMAGGVPDYPPKELDETLVNL